MMKTADQILSKFLDPSQPPSEEVIRRLVLLSKMRFSGTTTYDPGGGHVHPDANHFVLFGGGE